MTIDLNKFCGDETGLRYYLNQPFILNDRVVASNGHIVVSIPRDGRVEATLENAKVAQAICKILMTEFKQYVPLSSIELPAPEACTKCPKPEDLSPDEVCYNCGGTLVTLHQPVLVGATSFARRYLALIAELPDAEIGTSVDEKQSAVPFRFTGGHGCLMPMRT